MSFDDKLKAFALEVLRERNGVDCGADIEEIAMKHGVLAYVEVTEPCCESCTCADVDSFPTRCLRMAE